MYKNLKQIAWQCNLELPKHGLVTYTFGNVSAIDRDKGVVAIKPSGISYDELKPEDMVVVDL
ncbi:MAG: class II aldolase/adducin family protein, partial [Candidatus Omnitrophica bacterium]|nr:class II aldolase/adducin family protein [Candidatus Omnitrophota bacterium]